MTTRTDLATQANADAMAYEAGYDDAKRGLPQDSDRYVISMAPVASDWQLCADAYDRGYDAGLIDKRRV